MSNPLLDHDKADGNVQFSTIWRSLAVLSFAMLSAIFLGLLTWGLWVTSSINTHDKLLAVLQERSGHSEGSGITQSVNVGEVQGSAALTEEAGSAKSWLTTQDVAKREQVTDRTVLSYIAQGLIEPPPEKLGKEWHIAEEYRILPNAAENCGDTP